MAGGLSLTLLLLTYGNTEPEWVLSEQFEIKVGLSIVLCTQLWDDEKFHGSKWRVVGLSYYG